MPTLPSQDGGRDLLEQKIEAGMQNAKSSAARGSEHADASYAIVRKLRENPPEAAKSVKGHLPPLRARTLHSSRTSPVNMVAQRNLRITAVIGNARILAARSAQISVCKSLIAVNTYTSPWHEPRCATE